MTHTPAYQQSLTAAVAHEHVRDLLRAADSSRIAACLPDEKHRTPRRRPSWWLRIATRTTTIRTA